MKRRCFALAALFALAPAGARAICPYDVNCMNNPYGGHDNSAAPFGASPYGRGQPGAAFNANPLRGGGGYDPYAPAVNSDEQPAAPTPGGLGLGSTAAPPDGSQGIDPDRPK